MNKITRLIVEYDDMLDTGTHTILLCFYVCSQYNYAVTDVSNKYFFPHGFFKLDNFCSCIKDLVLCLQENHTI
jgi:hypothetical protein